MEDTREALLKKKFPKLYSNLYSKEDLTLPRSIQLFGIECGDGWYDLIYRLSETLELEISKLPKDIQDDFYVVQIKEKYGTLRFYMSYETDTMTEAIDRAEVESATICEGCSRPGTLQVTHGWYKVRCKDCT